MAGCVYFQTPRTYPGGEPLVVGPAVAPCPPGEVQPCQPYQPSPGDIVAVTLQPRQTVAPVGAVVVLVAGVHGADGYLRTNQRLDWSIAPGSSGQFVDVQRNGWVDLLLGDFNDPRKVNNTFAIGSTSRESVRLPEGGLCVLPGQGWITVTSPLEGTSHVTVFAPEVACCGHRMDEAVICWIDAQCCFPPPAVNPAGSRHVLTTTVLRQTSRAPHAGWVVRYEIIGGPPAGFAPAGARVAEVMTNAAGQASVEMFQPQPARGTNNITIQVIRPQGPGSPPLVVGSGSTLKTWTAADICVRKTGPKAAAVGATVTYRIEVSNPGDSPVRDVVLADEVPENFSYLSSTPAAELVGKRLQWRFGQLAPGQKQVVELNFRAVQQGSVANCAEVTTAGGLKASDCATTTVMAPTIDVEIHGPDQAAVGSQVTFEIVVTNRSQAPAAGLTIRDRYEPGLEHAIRSPIKRGLKDLAAGQTKLMMVTFRVAKAGRLCHTVQILDAGSVVATAEGCVTGVEPAGGSRRCSPSHQLSPRQPSTPRWRSRKRGRHGPPPASRPSSPSPLPIRANRP